MKTFWKTYLTDDTYLLAKLLSWMVVLFFLRLLFGPLFDWKSFTVGWWLVDPLAYWFLIYKKN
jgi:hypothetical protein